MLRERCLTEVRSLTTWSLSLSLQICFSSKGWPNKYAIGLICALNDFIQFLWFAIVSRLRDQELRREYTVDTMNVAGKKERQMSWAEIHISSINLFILSLSKQDMNNSLFYFHRMSQGAPSYAESEMAASNRNDPQDKRVCSGISSLVSHSVVLV